MFLHIERSKSSSVPLRRSLVGLETKVRLDDKNPAIVDTRIHESK